MVRDVRSVVTNPLTVLPLPLSWPEVSFLIPRNFSRNFIGLLLFVTYVRSCTSLCNSQLHAVFLISHCDFPSMPLRHNLTGYSGSMHYINLSVNAIRLFPLLVTIQRWIIIKMIKTNILKNKCINKWIRISFLKSKPISISYQNWKPICSASLCNKINAYYCNHNVTLLKYIKMIKSNNLNRNITKTNKIKSEII